MENMKYQKKQSICKTLNPTILKKTGDMLHSSTHRTVSFTTPIDRSSYKCCETGKITLQKPYAVRRAILIQIFSFSQIAFSRALCTSKYRRYITYFVKRMLRHCEPITLKLEANRTVFCRFCYSLLLTRALNTVLFVHIGSVFSRSRLNRSS